MKKDPWKAAIGASAEPVLVRRRVRELRGLGGGVDSFFKAATEPQAAVVCAVLGGSSFLANLLLRRPEWLDTLELSALKRARTGAGLRREAARTVEPLLKEAAYEDALSRLRELKLREMLRLAARDLSRLGTTPEITRELSNLADVCLEVVWQVCHARQVERHGVPYHQDPDGRWCPTGACVLGMGKLGGQELNYSSDVDVLFVYDEEGSVFREKPGRKKASGARQGNQEFFNRLGEAFIEEVTRTTDDGFLFRIDLRLRPEGASGPLARSLSSYENYYAQWGQTWERMMLIKARRVAGDNTVAGEFLEMVQPFRFPRALSQGALREVKELKHRIETEVLREDEVDRNVKLGRGGIREIEFIVQSLQLLHAGRQPFLQTSQTLPCLAQLARYGLLPQPEADRLSEVYCFLRDVEHRLQMEAQLQTHTVPSDKVARERLARLMGFKAFKSFEKVLDGHRAFVREVFDRLLNLREGPEEEALPAAFEGHAEEWASLLQGHHFRDVDKACRVLREFVEGPGFVHTSPRTVQLARQLVPRLLAYCRRENGQVSGGRLVRPVLSDPDRVLIRLDSFIGTYGARATLFELWARYPLVFESLVLLFDRSEFLAELAIRTPDLLDDMVVSGRLRRRMTAADTLQDLGHGIEDADQHAWIRTYQQAELMRLGCRDILQLAGPQQTLESISALADGCLQYALAVVCRRHGSKTPPFAVFGLGKLAGRELSYGSDLDIVFVAKNRVRNLARVQKLAVELMDLLSARTELGIAFITDARLRPDGETGLLVNTLEAYETYYRNRARLWEIQSISRMRFIAGDATLGNAFEALTRRLSNFAEPDVSLAAYSPDWKHQIHEMRMRIEKERTPSERDALAIKTGRGGLMDVEFVAQALCLQNGWAEPNTLAALERAYSDGLLVGAEEFIVSYLRLRRFEVVLRRWSGEGETLLPTDPAAFERVGIRCGYASPESFTQALTECRGAIRAVYETFFLGDAGGRPRGATAR